MVLPACLEGKSSSKLTKKYNNISKGASSLESTRDKNNKKVSIHIPSVQARINNPQCVERKAFRRNRLPKRMGYKKCRALRTLINKYTKMT